MIDEELLQMIVCPQCKNSLLPLIAPPSLVCRSCSVRFPLRDGIPVLLIDEAEPITAAREG